MKYFALNLSLNILFRAIKLERILGLRVRFSERVAEIARSMEPGLDGSIQHRSDPVGCTTRFAAKNIENEVCACNSPKIESLESLRSKNGFGKCPCRYSQIREFVIRFGGRFVQLAKQGLCPVTETPVFENPNRVSRLRVLTRQTSV
jgi:hypothetical protein